jgi:hypothetical protein
VEKKMSEDKNISKFIKRIEDLEDENILKVSLEMLRDMIKMKKLQEEIEQIEESFLTPEKSITYFFAQSLNDQEVIWAAEKISGMLKFMESNNAKK